MAKKSFVDALVDSVNNTGYDASSPDVESLVDSVHNTGIHIPPDYNPNPSYLDLVSRAQDMLSKGSSLQDFLRLLTLYSGPMSGAQGADVSKQLLDQLINYAVTLENRGYNEQLRDEQRVYDAPSSQLARLMGAGISRDAAIQMISGSGSSGGSGVPFSDPAAASASSIPATQSDLNKAQSDAAYANIGLGAISSIANIAGAIGSLGSFGVSAAQLSTNLAATKAQTAGSLLSNTQFSKTLQGIETASTVVGALQSAVDAGIIDKDHDFGSSQDMLSAIRDNADKFEPFKALVVSGALNGINHDVYSLNALNGAYKSWRESHDYGIDRSHLVRMQSLEWLQGDMNIKLASSEISLNSQKIAESIQSVINDNLRVQNETSLANANVLLIDEQAYGVKQENVVKRLDAEWYKANIEDINSARLGQIALEAAEWRALFNDPKALKKTVETWLLDKDNARTAAALESLYLSDEYDTQATLHDPNNSSYNARQTALWFHNLFNFALGDPQAGQEEAASLGKMAKSAAMLFLFRKM